MQRRDFFKLGARNAAKLADEIIEAKKTLAGKNWVRPPFALEETEFLDACTKCGDCIDACAFQVIFKLPESVGSRSEGTPALDLLNHGCHMCEDWPCVTVCKPLALKRSEDEDTLVLPKLASVVINTNTCLPYLGPECGACADSCPVPGTLNWNGSKPVIDADACTGCALCREACITEPRSILVERISAP